MIPFRDSVPARRYPVVTIAIIVVNVLVFIYQLTMGSPRQMQAFVYTFGMIPARLTAGEMFAQYDLPSFGLTMVTSMFLHGGLAHLFGNMLYMWVFADNVEDRMGAWRFAFFYLICGVGAGLVHILFNPGSTVPTIGASGAVSGVLGAYLLLYPKARVLVLVPLLLIWPVIELPAMLVLGIWFLLQLLSGTSSLGAEQVGGVAWWAHVGGFLIGFLLVHFFDQRDNHKHEDYWYAHWQDRDR
ncbi:MAG TPA: rhomboid family intramembrane serine protease [Acidobacteriota bacterium]|nr:rhomboid family intramembrane serine protease [Acidobacteriota bacterium]